MSQIIVCSSGMVFTQENKRVQRSAAKMVMSLRLNIPRKIGKTGMPSLEERKQREPDCSEQDDERNAST